MMAAFAATPVFATRIDGETLRVEPSRAVTPEMRDYIRANKPAIMAALSTETNIAADLGRSRTPLRAISYGEKPHEMPILSNSDDLVRVAAELNAWNAYVPVSWAQWTGASHD